MQQEFVTIRFDKSHLSTIGERLYTQSLDLVRELVANAYDADATRVDIDINDTGITVSDNGSGMDKDGLAQYFTIGSGFKKENPVSPKFKRIRIGEFGIGKFAVLSICDRFEIYSRSESYAATLLFDRVDFEKRNDWNVPLVEHQISSGEETCTRVSLTKIKKVISVFDLERHLTNIFPLGDKSFAVYVNGRKLSSKFVPGERIKIKEILPFGEVAGEIIISSLMLSHEQVGIGIRVKGILIKRETFDIEKLHSFSVKRLTGEIRADFLPITASRDEFVKDSREYQEFVKIIAKKLRKVVKTLEDSAVSYQDKKAEKILSDALTTIKEALRKNSDILLLEGLPLFSRGQSRKRMEAMAQIQGSSVSTVLSSGKKEGIYNDDLRKALKSIRPKIRSRIRTLLRDDHRIIKKFKIGGSEFLVSFAKLGEDEKESFSDGGIIYINREHRLFKKIAGKSELVLYHLIRLVTQEIIKFTSPKNLELAYEWQGKLIRDAFLSFRQNTDSHA